MRFHTSVQAPPRVVAMASARMINKMGRATCVARYPSDYGGPQVFSTEEELDAFLRDNWRRTDFHVRAYMRLLDKAKG